jgi:hypothetical protein
MMAKKQLQVSLRVERGLRHSHQNIKTDQSDREIQNVDIEHTIKYVLKNRLDEVTFNAHSLT